MLIEISVRWLTTKTVALEWKLKGSLTENSYLIVQRSDSPKEGFIDISTPVNLTGVASFVDIAPPGSSELKVYYYRLQLRNILDDEVLNTSAIMHPRRDRPKIALEIVRRNDLLLKRFVGLRAYLMTKSTSGSRCPSCWDTIKERRTKSHCSSCGDTGWDKGLSTPLPLFVSSSASLESKTVSVLGTDENIQRQLWTTNYPLIKPGDILVLDAKEIYRVETVNLTNFRETVVSQQLGVSLMEKDREYNNIPLPDFDEFSALDLIHRQYGGISTGEHFDYKDIEHKNKNFSIYKEGTEQ